MAEVPGRISEFDYRLGKQLLEHLSRKATPTAKELDQIERIRKILLQYEEQEKAHEKGV